MAPGVLSWTPHKDSLGCHSCFGLASQGLYWTLPKDRVEELEDMESEEEEEEPGHDDSAAALVEGSVHGDKPESGSGGGGGERGQSLVSLLASVGDVVPA